MNDDFEAEREFLRARTETLRDELREQEQLLGFSLNDDSVNALREDVMAGLRLSGNAPLADRYSAALERFRTAMRALEESVVRGEVNTSQRDAMNDAHEDYERIAAEATTWLERLDKNGGA